MEKVLQYLAQHGDEIAEPYDNAVLAVTAEGVVASVPLDEYETWDEVNEAIVARTREEYGSTDDAVYSFVRNGELGRINFVPDDFTGLIPGETDLDHYF